MVLEQQFYGLLRENILPTVRHKIPKDFILVCFYQSGKGVT